MTVATYNPAIFNVRTVDEAKRIILTDERGVTSEERWQHETPYLMGLIREHLPMITDESLVLDYGCGIGRIAKELIAEFGCRVVGVDVSPTMRGLAASYVDSDRFLACAPGWPSTWRADAAVAIWTLQHCHEPERDVANVVASMVPGARLFVANSVLRLVPTVESGWASDGKDVVDLLEGSLRPIRAGTLDPDAVGSAIARLHFWAVYEA